MTMSKRICCHCVREPYLQQQIADHGTEFGCSYCSRQVRASGLEPMADRVEAAFEQHYERTPQDPTGDEGVRATASDTPWSRHGQSVVDTIRWAAEIPRAAAADIQRILECRHYDKHADRAGEETEFCSEAHYEEREVDDDHWRERWFEFERTIKSEARFFGHRAKELLTEAFANIDNVEEIAAGGGQPLVIDIVPGTRRAAIYRARVFQSADAMSEALRRPDLHLGPPPGHLAPANRMNAHGISVFYGATDPETAIAEVRPSVGSFVAVARFEVIRPLRVLSLGYLGFAIANGSIFDESYADLRKRALFLQSLSDLLSEPVVHLNGDLDYLATQAVADYLATENDPRLDGIAYPSTQSELESATNVALFRKAARVDEMDLPEGTVIEVVPAIDEEGFETGFQVIEFLAPGQPDAIPNHRDEYSPSRDERDYRRPTLRIDLESLQVREVTGVRLSTDTHTVLRKRVASAQPHASRAPLSRREPG